MKRRKIRDSLVGQVEGALAPGEFVGWRESSVFVADLETAKEGIDALVTGDDPAAAVDLYEIFIAACYEKADEVDDSDGAFGTFAGTLFPAWIRARQASGSDPEETARMILSWMEDDDYGFCLSLEERAVDAFDRKGLNAWERVVRREWLEGGSGAVDDNDYRHRRAFTALRAVTARRGDAEAYEQVCRESGEFEPADCRKLAEICLRRKRPEDALAWIERGLALQAEGTRWRRSAGGLAREKWRILKKLGRGREALTSAWEAYRRRPSAHSWDELMEFVPRQDRAKWRLKALEAAEGGGLSERISLFTKLGERDRLSDLVGKADRADLISLSHYTTKPAAEELEGKHPLTAAKLHVALGLRIVEAKKSRYYDAAIAHLEKARDLLLKSGRREEWEDLVREIRGEHSRKYSFMPGFERVVEGRRTPTFMDRVQNRRDRGPGGRRRR